jgi:uncharacterized protein with HEPN domain
VRDHRLFLKDILEAMDRIQAYVEGMSFTDFVADDKTVRAVIQKLEVIGEAAKRIPVEIRQAHPEVPWQERAGMRDRRIHAYFRVDYNLVWRAIQERTPQVRPLTD